MKADNSEVVHSQESPNTAASSTVLVQSSTGAVPAKDQEVEMSSGTYRTAASDESPHHIPDHKVKSILEQRNLQI